MPYSSVEDIPQSVKDRLKSPKKRRQWMHVWNSSYKEHKDEDRAFAAANSVVNKAATPIDGEESFSFFMPICKVDKERRTVSGYASTECLDFDGERVSREAIKSALPGYWGNIREMHKPWAVGTAKETSVDDKGLYVVAKIVDDEAWKKVDEGVYKGFSVGGKKLAKVGDTITKLDLVEISVVDRPANPECRFTVQKSAKIDEGGTVEAYLVPLDASKSDETRIALRKMAEVVEFLTTDSVDEISKREFSSKEREAAAGRGQALPGGGFPIENEGDLKNAIRAIGRAKNPDKTKKHIKRRAKALGLESLIPDTWKSAKKLAKEARVETRTEPEESESASSTFLTLDADGGAEAVLGKIGFSHELDLETASPGLQEDRLRKRMSSAGSLAYAFDNLRGVQRNLIAEAKTEGGDRRDLDLARRVGGTAQTLAEIISQKALHEGEEALSLTDADDVNFLSIHGDGVLQMSVTTDKNSPDALTKFVQDLVIKAAQSAVASGAAGPSPKAMLKAASDLLKAAKKDREDMEECVKGLFEAHKSAFLNHQKLVKAGKIKDNDADDKFDHESAMKMLKTVYSGLGRQKELHKSARDTIKKAAGRIGGEGVVEDGVGGVYDVPAGVKTISPGEMDNLPAAKMAKLGFVSKTEAEALAKAAAAEAQVAILSKLPAGPANGQRPYNFDVTKVGLSNGDEANPVGEFFKGANPANLVSDNEKIREAEVSKAIGNQILGGKGKSLFDPNFRGTGGIGGSESARAN